MRRNDAVDIWLLHSKLSAYLRQIDVQRILAQTSQEEARVWEARTHCRSLRVNGRMVGNFTPETRKVIERYRAMGALR